MNIKVFKSDMQQSVEDFFNNERAELYFELVL